MVLAPASCGAEAPLDEAPAHEPPLVEAAALGSKPPAKQDDIAFLRKNLQLAGFGTPETGLIQLVKYSQLMLRGPGSAQRICIRFSVMQIKELYENAADACRGESRETRIRLSITRVEEPPGTSQSSSEILLEIRVGVSS
jgi:hypothetical protein